MIRSRVRIGGKKKKRVVSLLPFGLKVMMGGGVVLCDCWYL